MSAVATRPLVETPAFSPFSAVLTAACDGYPAGTTGTVHGHRQGCAVFVPTHPERVARWAVPRTELLVPVALVVTAG